MASAILGKGLWFWVLGGRIQSARCSFSEGGNPERRETRIERREKSIGHSFSCGRDDLVLY
jgi:hypothetical protein